MYRYVDANWTNSILEIDREKHPTMCSKTRLIGNIRPIKPLPPNQIPNLPLLPHLPPNFILPIHPPSLSYKPMPQLKYVIPKLPHPLTQQLPFQLRSPHIQLQLKTPVRRVVQHQINVVVENRRTGPKRQHASLIRKRVEAVVGAFDYNERRVNGHPVDQVAQLANATADATSGFAEGQFHAFDIAAFACWPADQAAEEVFPGADDDAVDGGDREFEVDDFVVLQGEVGVAEFADQFRGV